MTFTRLRTEWFTLIDRLYDETKKSSLPCSEYCPNCLCEKDEKVYFLPFEMEYISEITGIDLKASGFFWTMDIPYQGQNLPIALKSKQQICPLLSEDNQCTIHENRPFDCRSFPLMPVFNNEQLSFELEIYCPLVNVQVDAQLKHFIKLYTRLWTSLVRRLPDSWKYLYWHSSTLIPEIDNSQKRPCHLDLSKYLIQTKQI